MLGLTTYPGRLLVVGSDSEPCHLPFFGRDKSILSSTEGEGVTAVCQGCKYAIVSGLMYTLGQNESYEIHRARWQRCHPHRMYAEHGAVLTKSGLRLEIL